MSDLESAESAESAGSADSADRLETAASKLRLRGGLPVDRWFQLAGAVLPLLGLLGIAAAWYGVSHTAREWRQTPYVVSGGLLGLGLIFLGGFAYFAYWLTKLVEQSHRQTAVLERIEAAVSGRSTQSELESDALVTAGGVAHRADCALLAGNDDVRPLPPSADVPACPVCEPDLPVAEKARARRRARPRARSRN